MARTRTKRNQSLQISRGADPHSFGNPHQIRITHVDLDLDVDLQHEQLNGTAKLSLQRQPGCSADAPIILDTKNLEILNVWARGNSGRKRAVPFVFGQSDPILGTPLVVSLSAGDRQVIVQYRTTDKSEALQWLPAGKGRQKSLFTQGQCIFTRTWIPLHDSPGALVTYKAKVKTPSGVQAVMSAEPRHGGAKNVFRFAMPKCISPYGIALFVGELAFRRLGPRTGVYAPPDMIDAAAWEFAEAEKMIEILETQLGPFGWGEWNILVMPPSFPLGGMENPWVAFLTPTLLAGDRSLTATVVHEATHNWSGYLVSIKSYSHFWLNEGFTTYNEWRAVEELYGVERAQMQRVLAVGRLLIQMKDMKPCDQILNINLNGRDPEEGSNLVPYVKGGLFLLALERAFGRARMDAFRKSYFKHFAFCSITTSQFEDYLQEHLLKLDPIAAASVDVYAWIHEPGLPDEYRIETSPRLVLADKAARDWLDNQTELAAIETDNWSMYEWLQFLSSLTVLSCQQMAQLDERFKFTQQRNALILQRWLLMSVRFDYAPAYSRLNSVLGSVGRQQFIVPLFQEIIKANGVARATEMFELYRGTYHPMVVTSVEKILAGHDVFV